MTVTKEKEILVDLLPEGRLFPWPENGLLPYTWKWTARGDTPADKAKDIIGKRCLGREQWGKGVQNCSVTWRAVLGFMRMGLVFRVVSGQLSCSAHTCPSWWCSYLSAKRDSSARDSGRLVVSSWLLLKAAPWSLSGPPVVRLLRQAAIIMPGSFSQWSSNRLVAIYGLMMRIYTFWSLVIFVMLEATYKVL